MDLCVSRGICEICGAEIAGAGGALPPHRTERRYCSRVCAQKARASGRNCLWCGKTLRAHRRIVGYCSSRCQEKGERLRAVMQGFMDYAGG